MSDVGTKMKPTLALPNPSANSRVLFIIIMFIAYLQGVISSIGKSGQPLFQWVDEPRGESSHSQPVQFPNSTRSNVASRLKTTV